MLFLVFCKNVRFILAILMISDFMFHNWCWTTLFFYGWARTTYLFQDLGSFWFFYRLLLVSHPELSAWLLFFEHYSLQRTFILELGWDWSFWEDRGLCFSLLGCSRLTCAYWICSCKATKPFSQSIILCLLMFWRLVTWRAEQVEVRSFYHFLEVIFILFFIPISSYPLWFWLPTSYLPPPIFFSFPFFFFCLPPFGVGVPIDIFIVFVLFFKLLQDLR